MILFTFATHHHSSNGVCTKNVKSNIRYTMKKVFSILSLMLVVMLACSNAIIGESKSIHKIPYEVKVADKDLNLSITKGSTTGDDLILKVRSNYLSRLALICPMSK